MTGDISFEQFLALDRGVSIDPVEFILNLLLAAASAWILSRLYIRYGTTLSNRRFFADNFVLLTVTTMLIISVVKLSLALSLGLVGALSIVRFRSAIKEPEELCYLFICIAIGLGFGAGRMLITLGGLGFIAAVIVAKGLLRDRDRSHNLFVTVTSSAPEESSLERIIGVLRDHCDEVSMQRFDENHSVLDATFRISVGGWSRLEAGKRALLGLIPEASVSYIDQSDLP